MVDLRYEAVGFESYRIVKVCQRRTNAFTSDQPVQVTFQLYMSVYLPGFAVI
jgi:hypothetical protein